MLSQNELKDLLYGSLDELGCTDNEKKLYVLSLFLGPATLSDLAEHLGIPRPNVYKVIDGLEKKQLAKFSERKKFARTFMVEPPTKVTELLREKREAVARLDQTITASMPDLLSLYRQGELPTSIRIFQGEEQFRKSYEILLQEAQGTIQFFGSLKDFVGFNTWLGQQNLINRRMERGLKTQVLVLPCPEAEAVKAKDAQENRETRLLDAAMPPFVTSFQVFGKKVIIWQPKAPLAMLIEDEYMTQMLQSVFHHLWVKAKN